MFHLRAVFFCLLFFCAKRKVTTPDGQLKWLARVEWCLVTLEKSGLIRSQDAQYQITDAGRKLSGEKVTMKFLMELGMPALIEFVKSRRAAPKPEPPKVETPEEIFEQVHRKINAALSDELLKILSEQSATFFEKLTVKLVERMGYGLGEKTAASDDGGIDGIIYGDKLGFDRIGIQAKLWSADKVVGRPEIQKFYGALAGKIDKGLFVTTAKFSQKAREYAADKHIILIDGKRLAELMIEFDVGVSTQKVYKIKRVDTDFFVDTQSQR